MAAMDLIRWIILFFDSLRVRQPITENPKLGMDLRLVLARVAPVQTRSGGRMSRGPTSVNRRSDL